MKKISSFILVTLTFALVAPVFTACSSDDNDDNKTINNIVSEYDDNDQMVANAMFPVVQSDK